jgi:hypothetical protein
LQPSKLSIAGLFESDEQYLIPLFQRGYVWTIEKQIEPLWADIVDRVEALAAYNAAKAAHGPEILKPLRKHFLGAVVLGASVGFDSEAVDKRDVIDGQQRITTLQIMLLALKHVCAPLANETIDQTLRKWTYNVGEYRLGGDHLKVWPTNVSRDVMVALATAKTVAEITERYPVKTSTGTIERPLMVQAFLYFHGILTCFVRGKRFDDPLKAGEPSEDAKTISQALIRSIRKDNDVIIPLNDQAESAEPAKLLVAALKSCFQIMRLQLENDDDPQIVFETLNARGEPLTPSDLIRNYVFLRAARKSPASVDALYGEHWQPFDDQPDLSGDKGADKFWRREERQGRLKTNRLDLFFYHYMSLRKLDEVKVTHVFQEFKDWWEGGGPRDMPHELGRIAALSRQFSMMLLPDQKTRFGLFCRRLRLLDTATPIPLVLYLLEHHKPNAPEFIQAIGDIESYLVRRFICGLTTKSYNRTFIQRLLAEMAAEGKTDAATLRAKLLALDGSSQVWPRDADFEPAWIHRRLYEGANTRRVRAILEGLEIGLSTAKQEVLPDLDTLTVEHVLPQKWEPEDYPLSADTAEARARRTALLHSIGNLTLVTPSFNSGLSNEAFEKKRPEIAANSRLMLNAYFQTQPVDGAWNEEAIVQRAGNLFTVAKAVWSIP